jgi:hypothetical protein
VADGSANAYMVLYRLPQQRRIQVCTLKPQNVSLRTGQFAASYLALPDPKQERSWLYLEVSSTFGGSQPFGGYGIFPRCRRKCILTSFHEKEV